MSDPRRQGRYVDPLGLVDLLRFRLLDMIGRRLDLDDVGADQGGDLRRIRGDVDCRLALFRQVAAARIGPHHDHQADRLRLARELANFLDQLVLIFRAGINREADRRTAETQRVLDRGRHRLVLDHRMAVGIVHLENGRDRAGKTIGARLDHPERRRIGAETGIDRELIMVMRIVPRRIWREAARRAVLEALVDRQNNQFARTGQFAVHQNARQIALGARIVALVIGQNLTDPLGHFHTALPSVFCRGE